jgi:hypothetical protein
MEVVMSGLTPLAATGIGSVPFTEARQTVTLILETLPQLPYWPQLVQLGFLEDMTAQSARGLPALKLDLEARTVQIDPALPRDEALAQFYEVVLSGDLSPFAFVEADAQGFFALLDAVAADGCPCTVLKGQLSGPVTFAGVVKDADGKPILYDRELTQAVSSGLARKAAWQAEKFRQLGKHPVVFLDEPFLSGFGSAYLPISREDVTEILSQALEEVRGAATGPVTLGTHCCGNTDWSLLLSAPLDIVSFDSYGYFESLRLYGEALSAFLARGGWLAWGLVPTLDPEEFERQTVDTLWQRFQEQVTHLSADLHLAPQAILSQAILTPACGTGFMSPEAARRVLTTLAELSARAQEWLAAL